MESRDGEGKSTGILDPAALEFECQKDRDGSEFETREQDVELCTPRREGETKTCREESRGEDVTSQVVDLEARLSNERRIEVELLELLERRDDAPLKDVLELRRQISAVRESVERLVAQQQRMSRLTELASVLVIIRPEAAPPEEHEPATGLGAYFSDRINTSWTGGIRYLADSVAGGLQLLVGGLLWWLILVVVVMPARHYVRQAKVSPTA